MKILLTTPLSGDFPMRNPMPPLGITYIAGVLEQEGHLVKILDNYLERNNKGDIVKTIKDLKPSIVGITCNADDRFEAFKLSRIIKDVSSSIIVVLGGSFPSVCHKEIMEDIESVDIVVRGEGEYTLLDIANCVDKQKQFGNILGISYRMKDKIRINKPRPFIQNLDTLPFPAFHLLKIREYPNYMDEFKESFLDKTNTDVACTASLIFGRGCPYNCLFCSSKELWCRSIRMLSPENAVRQVEYFIDKGINAFAFWDDHLMLNKKWFDDFVQQIKHKKLQFIFKCLGRVDSVSEEIAKKLREIGCRMIWLGIENGSQDILNIMNKGTTVVQIENAVKFLNESKILSMGTSLVNTPGETFENILENLRFLKKMEQGYRKLRGEPAGIIMYKPVNIIIYPGTDLEKIAIEKSRLVNFKWTKNYYEKRNLLVNSSPHTPLYENVAIEKLIEYLIVGALKIRHYTLLESITLNQIIDDSMNFELAERNYRLKFYISIIFGIISKASLKDKIDYIYVLFFKVVCLKIKNRFMRLRPDVTSGFGKIFYFAMASKNYPPKL